MSQASLVDLARHRTKYGEELIRLEGEVKALKAKIARFDYEIKKELESLGQEECVVSVDGERVKLKINTMEYYAPAEGRKEDVIAWLKTFEEHAGVVTETVNNNTLGAICRRMAAEGTEIPDCVKRSPVQRLGVSSK